MELYCKKSPSVIQAHYVMFEISTSFTSPKPSRESSQQFTCDNLTIFSQSIRLYIITFTMAKIRIIRQYLSNDNPLLCA